MRRNDREISGTGEVDEIIRKADVCRIAFANDNIPYVVTMNFGYMLTRLDKRSISIVQMKEKNWI